MRQALVRGVPGTNKDEDDLSLFAIRARRNAILATIDEENKRNFYVLKAIGMGLLTQSPLDGSLLSGYNESVRDALRDACAVLDADVREAIEAADAEDAEEGVEEEVPDASRIAQFKAKLDQARELIEKGSITDPREFLKM